MATMPPEDDRTRMVPGSPQSRAAMSGAHDGDGNALRPGAVSGFLRRGIVFQRRDIAALKAPGQPLPSFKGAAFTMWLIDFSHSKLQRSPYS